MAVFRVDAVGAALKELEISGYLVCASCGTPEAGSQIPSTPSMSSRICLCRVWPVQIRKSRVWIPRIRVRLHQPADGPHCRG